jgi:hypothetical protein
MQYELSTVFLVLLALQVKHVFCDGPLQTLRMVEAKSHYGRLQGLAHAAIHAAGTFFVLMLSGLPLGLAAQLGLLDGVVHYHIDFTKENVVKARKWSTTDGPFWWSFTTDQALHHMTYVMLVWLAFRP